METLIKRLKSFDFFSDLDRRDIIEFCSTMTSMSAQSKELVFEKGEPIHDVYLVVTGSVKIQDTVPVKKTKVFNFLGRGEFLGVAMAGLPQPKFPATAVCNEDCTFIKIPLKVLFTMILKFPRVRAEINRQTSERFLEFQNDISKAHRLAPFRLADFLLRLTDRQRPELRRLLPFPLTRSDIGQRIGAETETVIRILSAWTKKSWIRTTDRHIEILDRAALESVDNGRQPRKRIQRSTFSRKRSKGQDPKLKILNP